MKNDPAADRVTTTDRVTVDHVTADRVTLERETIKPRPATEEKPTPTAQSTEPSFVPPKSNSAAAPVKSASYKSGNGQ